MADYLGNYNTAMDREYFEPLSSSEKEQLMPMGQISISANPMIDQLQALKTRIFQGASKVELGFMGSGKGSMQGGNTTPEMYSREHREAIRELAEINRVEITTHATPRTGSLAGTGQEGFSDETRRAGLFEIQKAIDFAADVARGGAVVVHTGEWQRGIGEVKKYKDGGDFSSYNFTDVGGKKEEEIISLADEKTGGIQRFRKDFEIYEPVIKESVKTESGDIINIYNKINGVVEIKKKGYKDIIDEIKEKERDNIRYDKEKNVFEVKTEEGKWERRTEEQVFARRFMQAEYDKALTESLRYNPEKEKERIDEMENQFETLKKEGKINPEKESLFKQQIMQEKRQLHHMEEHNALSAAQARKTLDNIDKMKPLEEVGLKKTAETVAQAAVYAYKKEIEMKLEKPLFVAPENIFPEQYGAHPQELKRIIQASRETMTKYIMDNPNKFNISTEAEAKKAAESHIKATFDIGHAYTWKKYFNGEEKDFNKWLLNQVDDLVKDKIIGHVHISDNFGYDDEHVTPGEGKVPIAEFVNIIKKDKSIGMNVEPAHQDFEALMGAWRLFGSPITGLGGSRTDRWTNLEGGYFGKTRSPYFVFGEYAPSDEYRGSPFWTGLPLE